MAPVLSSLSTVRLGSQTSVVAMGILVAAIILLTVPMEIPELTLGLVGAIVYSVLQVVQGKSSNKQTKLAKSKLKNASLALDPSFSERSVRNEHTGFQRAPRAWQNRNGTPQEHKNIEHTRLPKKDYRQPSAAPVLAPTFTSVGWEAEVQELLLQTSPTPESTKVVHRLVECVRQAIQPIIPEAEVTGFATGNLKRGRAFAVAIPDVDIVVSVSPPDLVRALQQLLQRSGSSHISKIDARKLQKSAIRACTDRLVTIGGFKFRRSSFKGQEPKVTLLASSSLGGSDDAIPVDFSVNSHTPLHNAALLTECGQLEPRSKALILLVQRWARDRGISHAAKGHLPPYAWSLLTIYFLQTGAGEQGPFLPSVDKFERASLLLKKGQAATDVKMWAPSPSTTSVGALFKAFVRFYETEFQWRSEAVCVRTGSRAAPALSLPIHIPFGDDGLTTFVAPSIEDPFEVSNNVGALLTGAGCLRLREEFARAHEHCSRDVSLADLLEPWAPPEWAATENGNQAAEA